MNKLALLGFVLLLVIGGFIYFHRTAPITNYPPKVGTVVAFGDSLVVGKGSSEGYDFVSVLAEKLQTKIINKGVNGDTTASALERVDEIIELNPKLVILVIGGNDALQKIPSTTTFANIEKIVVALQKSGAIVVIGGVQGGIFTDRFKSEYQRIATQYQTGYVPNILNGLINRPEYMSDSVHPNDIGYPIIADKFYPVVKPLLK